VIDPSKPPSGRNVERRKLRVLDRPYPQAVAGTPESYSYRPRTDRFDLTYSTAATLGELLRRRIETRVYIPRLHYHRHYSVDVSGAAVVSRKGARYLRLRRARGANEVSVEVRPTQ
jgi:endoglycosylceramidase